MTAIKCIVATVLYFGALYLIGDYAIDQVQPYVETEVFRTHMAGILHGLTVLMAIVMGIFVWSLPFDKTTNTEKGDVIFGLVIAVAISGLAIPVVWNFVPVFLQHGFEVKQWIPQNTFMDHEPEETTLWILYSSFGYFVYGATTAFAVAAAVVVGALIAVLKGWSTVIELVAPYKNLKKSE